MTHLHLDLFRQMAISGEPTYLVVDGALVKDIRKTFQSHGVAGTSLFHQRAAPTIALAGPWMVALGDNPAENIENASAVAQDCRSGILWSAPWSAIEMASHLRKLNVAKLPTEGLVYFRHYDADVLASVCPLLDGSQAARLLGLASTIGFLCGRGAGATVNRPPDLPPPQSGPLAFYDWQVERLAERQRLLLRKKISVFLRQALPNDLKSMSDAELLHEVTQHEISAKKLGLNSEKAFTQWAHLGIMSKNKITEDRDVRELITKDGELDANKALEENFYSIISNYYRGRLSFQRRGVKDDS